MAKWELMERGMIHFRNPSDMAYKFRMITSVIMLLAIGNVNNFKNIATSDTVTYKSYKLLCFVE